MFLHLESMLTVEMPMGGGSLMSNNETVVSNPFMNESGGKFYPLAKKKNCLNWDLCLL